MIGRLKGLLVEKQPPSLILDINGVGYEVEASMHTFYRLPELGEVVTLYIHFVVREDAQLLYGFYDKEERGLFRTLIKVNGVGPKLALTILSSVTPMEFAQFVHDNNSVALTKLPGVGKKTAERLIIEMRDKLDTQTSSQTIGAVPLAQGVSPAPKPEQEAVSALIALGYKPQEASRAIAGIDVSDLTSQEIIKLALKGMVV